MSTRFRPLLVVSLMLLTGAAWAVDLPSNLPKRKPGLWEMQMSGMGGQPQIMKLCVDEATDQAMYQMGAQMSGSMCSKYEISVKGNVVLADGVCSIPAPQGKIAMTSHSETRFDGNTSYKTEGHIKYDPAVQGRSEANVSSSGRWVGPCATGQKPGDMVMPNGATMNIKDMGGK